MLLKIFCSIVYKATSKSIAPHFVKYFGCRTFAESLVIFSRNFNGNFCFPISFLNTMKKEFQNCFDCFCTTLHRGAFCQLLWYKLFILSCKQFLYTSLYIEKQFQKFQGLNAKNTTFPEYFFQ